MMKIITNNFELKFDKKTPLIVLFFLYIFAPPLLPINMNIIIEGIAVIYVIFSLIKSRRNFAIRLTEIKLIAFFIPFFLYITVMLMIHINIQSNYYEGFMDTYNIICRVFIRGIIIIFAYALYCKRNNFSIDDWFAVIYWVGLIQVFFVVMTLLFPQLRENILNMIQQNSTADVVVDVIERLSSRRGYGLASNLFDAFGYLLAFMVCVTMLLWFEDNDKKKIVACILLLVANLLNSRTGVLLSLIAIVACFIIYKKSYRHMKIIILAMVSAVPIFLIGINIIEFFSPDTLAWVSEGIEELSKFIFEGERTGIFAAFSDFTFFPNDIVFGAGAPPDYLVNRWSDIGYIICIWDYGIVGTVLLLGGYIASLFYAYKNALHSKEKTFAIAAITIFLVYLYKLYSIGNLGANFIIFSFVITVLINSKKIKSNQVYSYYKEQRKSEL